jgi:hypothetical protein
MVSDVAVLLLIVFQQVARIASRLMRLFLRVYESIISIPPPVEISPSMSSPRAANLQPQPQIIL